MMRYIPPKSSSSSSSSSFSYVLEGEEGVFKVSIVSIERLVAAAGYELLLLCRLRQPFEFALEVESHCGLPVRMANPRRGIVRCNSGLSMR
jgi:hypothetical protein